MHNRFKTDSVIVTRFFFYKQIVKMEMYGLWEVQKTPKGQ